MSSPEKREVKPLVLSSAFERLIPLELPNRDQIIQETNEILAKDELQQRIELIISPDTSQRFFRLNDLLELQRSLSSPAESIAAAQILENIVEARWKAEAHVMSCEIDMDSLRKAFADAEEIKYEFRPTKVDREITEGGLVKLLIGFPQGEKEQDRLHTHPSGRIVIAIMQEGQFHSPDAERARKMQHGTAILMPAGTPHNFNSIGDRDADVPENVTVDHILSNKVPGTVYLSWHLGGTKDLNDPEVVQYIK